MGPKGAQRGHGPTEPEGVTGGPRVTRGPRSHKGPIGPKPARGDRPAGGGNRSPDGKPIRPPKQIAEIGALQCTCTCKTARPHRRPPPRQRAPEGPDGFERASRQVHPISLYL